MEGSQESLLRQNGIEYLQMSSGGQKQPGALVAAPFEVRNPAAQPFDAGARNAASAGPLSTNVRSSSAESGAPASYFASAAARAR